MNNFRNFFSYNFKENRTTFYFEPFKYPLLTSVGLSLIVSVGFIFILHIFLLSHVISEDKEKFISINSVLESLYKTYGIPPLVKKNSQILDYQPERPRQFKIGDPDYDHAFNIDNWTPWENKKFSKVSTELDIQLVPGNSYEITKLACFYKKKFNLCKDTKCKVEEIRSCFKFLKNEKKDISNLTTLFLSKELKKNKSKNNNATKNHASKLCNRYENINKHPNFYYPHFVRNILDKEKKKEVARFVLCLQYGKGVQSIISKYISLPKKKGTSYAIAYIEEWDEKKGKWKLADYSPKSWNILLSSGNPVFNGLFISSQTKPIQAAKSFIDYVEEAVGSDYFLSYKGWDSQGFEEAEKTISYIGYLTDSLFIKYRYSPALFLGYNRPLSNTKSLSEQLKWPNLLIGPDLTGIIQITIIFLTFLGLFYYKILTMSKNNISNKILEICKDIEIGKKTRFHDAVRKFKNNSSSDYNQSALNIIGEPIQILANEGGNEQEVLEAECDVTHSSWVSENWPLRYLIWLIPIIGFIGTVIGITAAIPRLGGLLTDDQTLKQQLMDQMGRELGVAFGTTLIGLIGSVILQTARFSYEENSIPKKIIKMRQAVMSLFTKLDKDIATSKDSNTSLRTRIIRFSKEVDNNATKNINIPVRNITDTSIESEKNTISKSPMPIPLAKTTKFKDFLVMSLAYLLSLVLFIIFISGNNY